MSIKKDLQELGKTMTGEVCDGNTTKNVLKSLCKNLTGKESKGKTISDVIKDIDNNYPGKLIADVNVAASVDLLGKTINDLQKGVTFIGNNIVGELKYVTGYTGFSGDVSEQSGNYLVTHYTANSDNDIVVELVNGTRGPVTLDEDGILISRITNKTTQKIKVTCGDKVEIFDLTGLVLEPAPAE